jgi:hypothetical protein
MAMHMAGCTVYACNDGVMQQTCSGSAAAASCAASGCYQPSQVLGLRIQAGASLHWHVQASADVVARHLCISRAVHITVVWLPMSIG